MGLERISSHVDDLKRQVRERWSKLTRKDVDDIDFDVGRLSEVVAERYAIPAKHAREQVDKFVSDPGTSFREAWQLTGDVVEESRHNGASHVMDAVTAAPRRPASGGGGDAPRFARGPAAVSSSLQLSLAA